MTVSTASDKTKVMTGMAYKEEKMAPLLSKIAWMDKSNKQRKAREYKGKACNRAGTRGGTSNLWKVTLSDQGPSAC